ncbi:expressed protein [Chlorella variabilis]|uniref:Expressed protein n=1 Tax=Chlorella variabilis TaxID=554065 RepID=E1Z2T2_CHLVA|nr:expressed protein [Chlorella variabilis]EFN59718.1 expressed protein [Chlorella variabilis]|eukprot:XP_005851820.1 expressed protein [Chlorella variabilis]
MAPSAAAGCGAAARPRPRRRPQQPAARWVAAPPLPRQHGHHPIAAPSLPGPAAERAPEVTGSAPSPAADTAASHVELQPPEGGAAIHLFGVIHGGNESEVAEFIMRRHPQLVVVETSLNTAHGSAHGNTIRRQDCLTFAHAAAPGSHEQLDLDQAYGAMSAGNYADLVRQAAPHHRALASANATEAALLGERDAVMLSALHDASMQCGPGGGVVGVVGASHLAGMQRLWDSGGWRGMVAQGLLEAPTGPRTPETAEETGVRRALLDGVIRLSCRNDVQQDVRRVLGAVPPESHEAYSLAHELYGTTRMLLAVLDRQQLEEVCQGWRCDMWEVLAPVRAVRPLNGGPGFDRDLVLDLRTLNFEIG